MGMQHCGAHAGLQAGLGRGGTGTGLGGGGGGIQHAGAQDGWHICIGGYTMGIGGGGGGGGAYIIIGGGGGGGT